ncbi:bone morphogenetic protein 2 isoform X2 [Malurus melanocephalus]|uniref:bone morphogenetic protein 2 isoform X2 n=1 Tax=Malurus melanocephalus TaxID=175006 RepID=UPI00254746F6|nr:bone morphogenetic protein 2 isoform X2 [Malurus melanocephalus]
MVAVTRSLLALLLCQALLGGAAGLMPEVGRRRFSEPGRAASAAQRPEDLLSEFELRLLHMFGLKRRPSPGKDVVIPPYMLDLYRLHAGQQLGQPAALGFPLERAASRANTVRSFHHEEVLEELPETSGKTSRRFFFNLTSIPDEESITSAELQIFRKQVHGAFENNSSYHHRINIYEIIKPATATSKDPVTRLLDTRPSGRTPPPLFPLKFIQECKWKQNQERTERTDVAWLLGIWQSDSCSMPCLQISASPQDGEMDVSPLCQL